MTLTFNTAIQSFDTTLAYDAVPSNLISLQKAGVECAANAVF